MCKGDVDDFNKSSSTDFHYIISQQQPSAIIFTVGVPYEKVNIFCLSITIKAPALHVGDVLIRNTK